MSLNHRRILLGGLAAGVAMNIVDGFVNVLILGDQYQESMRRIHAEHLIGSSTAFWVSIDFLYAFAVSYLGASMRAQFGNRLGTHIRAAFVVWLVGYFTVGWDILVGIVPLGFHAFGTATALISFFFCGRSTVFSACVGRCPTSRPVDRGMSSVSYAMLTAPGN
jgi:hypothetical protein